jgi:hypothetical protein
MILVIYVSPPPPPPHKVFFKKIKIKIFGFISRLSSDLYTIDDSLPFILNILLANFVGLLGIAVVLSYVQVHVKFVHFACLF